MNPLHMNRRAFLGAAVATGGVLALPRLGLAEPAARSRPRRTLVLLHLNGGNDGINTVVPYTDRRYPVLRPSLALDRGQVRKISPDLGLHPALAGFETLFRQDRLAIVNGVGYPEPTLSHFRATEIWFTAQPERTPTYGWIGRALDARPTGKPLRAVALEKEHPLTLAMETPGAVSMTDFASFRIPAGMEQAGDLYRRYAALEGGRGEIGAAGTQALDVARRIASLKPAGGPVYGPLGDKLKRVVALLEADLELECIQLSMGGYDTHSNQAASHQRLLQQLGNNLRAYQGQLEAKGLAAGTVLLVISEFGRRATENLSGGTDHGTAGPVFLIGQDLAAGFHGEAPSLETLDRGNLHYTTDFRRVYAAVLEAALGIDPAPVLGDFPPLELFA